MYRLLCVFLTIIASQAEIIDRVAVVVGNRVITESEILREIRLTAFLNGEPLDFSPASKRKTAERLVEQLLIRNEIASSRYPDPAADAADQMLKEVQGKFPTRAQYEQELQRAGINEEELKAHMQRQLITLRFIEFRFRPGIQIGEDEMSKYFNQRLGPELKKTHPEMEFLLNDYRAEVEEALAGELVDKASGAWLKEVRDHTRIEYRPGVFAPDAVGQKAGK
jgi:peptidyl-prolyl cis-trans isomerase SurA